MLCFLCRDSLRGKSLMNLDCLFVVVWPQRQTFVRILLQHQNRSLLRADVRRGLIRLTILSADGQPKRSTWHVVTRHALLARSQQPTAPNSHVHVPKKNHLFFSTFSQGLTGNLGRKQKINPLFPFLQNTKTHRF